MYLLNYMKELPVTVRRSIELLGLPNPKREDEQVTALTTFLELINAT